jgi:quinoprotein glucose dehydrogenase
LRRKLLLRRSTVNVQMLLPTFPPLIVVTALATAFAAVAAAQDDPHARAALPKFQIIPAAKPEELTPAAKIDPKQFEGWTRSHGDNGSRRYSSLKQITRDNVKSLQVAWTYRSKDGAANVQCTPIVVDGVMFAPTAGRGLVAVDAATGVQLWRIQGGEPGRIENQPARRGLVYWPGDAGNPPRILFGSGNGIHAIDPKTGEGLAGFGEKGRVPIPTVATVAGAVYEHVYVTTGRFGDVYGYDVRNGKLLWRFHTVPQGSEWGADTWKGSPKDATQWSANGWGGLAIDDQRGLMFVVIGAPWPNMIGRGRVGDNLYSNCLLALDILTGERRWHFQDVRHDIWDLDMVGAPNLVTITREGRKVDAVTAVAKTGTLMLLDRVSGKPIFPFRLRRAPVSTLPGERTAPYQPDPELPEPISRMEFSPDDITNRTPEARAFVLKQVEHANYGFYQPFVEGKPTLFTGTRGGAEWSGAAVDVPAGRLYVTSNRGVSKINVFRNDEKERDPRFPPSNGEKHYQLHCAVCHGPTRLGLGMAPPLVSLKKRMSDADVLALLEKGRGAMPPNQSLNAEQKGELLDYLFRRNQPPTRATRFREPQNADRSGAGSSNDVDYVFDGFGFLNDHEGYPGIKPPWGLLNCYDLNTGRIIWRVPLGEIEALTRQGVPKTGSSNLGGASVTAGGLVFVAGTEDEKLRAFDADTGAELWSAKLPFAGTAAPAVYEVNGRQFVVITATGGGRIGGPSGAGDAYVAFALP